MALVRATLVASLVVWGAASARATPAAETVARAFCEAVLRSDEPAAEALMTPELRAAIVQLHMADAAFRIAHPDDKPPLGDGLRLTAFPDGVQGCTPEAVTADTAVLVYAPGIDPAALWRDLLVLAPAADGRVLVADILYAPDQTAGFAAWLADAMTWK